MHFLIFAIRIKEKGDYSAVLEIFKVKLKWYNVFIPNLHSPSVKKNHPHKNIIMLKNNIYFLSLRKLP